MYHLLEESDRKEAVRQCLNHLKPGGVFIASFISAYAPIVDYLKKSPGDIREYKERCMKYLYDGRNDKQFGFTDAYFTDPEEIGAFFSEFRLDTIRIMAAEGLGSMCESSLMQLPDEDFMEWMDLFYKIADKKVILGSCEHLIYIGRRKRDE